MNTDSRMHSNESLGLEKEKTIKQQKLNFQSGVKELLLVLPVPFLLRDKQLFFESQACNGLERWADNFGSVVVAAPVISEESVTSEQIKNSRNLKTLVGFERFEFVPLPCAYSMLKFLPYYPSVRATLGQLISRCRYLQFAIGGLWGDWASVAALEAHRQGRDYAIHTDRVEHLVILKTAKKANIKARVNSFLMQKYHELVIKNSALGLWHGRDCYVAYSRFCPNNYVIHNIHLKSSDSISSSELYDKIKQVSTDPILRICYAGRIEAMKAPLDWVKAIHKAKELGANIQATWFGQGNLIDDMKNLIEKLGLNSCINLAGYQRDHKVLLEKIKESHLMLFTHITPESPRCLLEALVCGTPIVGYHSAFAEDLIQNFGGGMFVPIHDWQQLGELLANLSKQRNDVSQLITEAAENGKRFNDEVVFRERSELIKKYLN